MSATVIPFVPAARSRNPFQDAADSLTRVSTNLETVSRQIRDMRDAMATLREEFESRRTL